jgi:HlyD family secretion protein
MALGLDPEIVDMESMMSGMGSMFASGGMGNMGNMFAGGGRGGGQGPASGGQRERGSNARGDAESYGARPDGERERGGRRGGGFAMGQFGQGGHVAGAVRTESAVVFVVGEDGAIEPRMVMIGLTDWDRTQVVSGLDDGDYVALIGVARLQAEREEFMERMRSNMGGGNPFGMGSMPGMRGMRGMPH